MKRLLISLLITTLLTPTLCPAVEIEPNDANGPLKFEFGKSEQLPWRMISTAVNKEGMRKMRKEGPTGKPSPIRPTYVTQVNLFRDYMHSLDLLYALNHDPLRLRFPSEQSRDRNVFRWILSSPLSQNLSEVQKTLLDTGFVAYVQPSWELTHDVWHGSTTEEEMQFFTTFFYAVSEADAKLTAQAYLDGLDKVARTRLLDAQKGLAETKEELAQAERDLSKKQAELKLCDEQYEPIRKVRCEFDDMSEAIQSARQTMADMDKMLNTLDIELVGLREKVKAIEHYRQSSQSLREQARARLDEMFVELMIEQSGLEARRDKTALIRAKEEQFLRLEAQHSRLTTQISQLQLSIDKVLKLRIEKYNELLPECTEALAGPKLLENTVVLYRLDDPNEPVQQ